MKLWLKFKDSIFNSYLYKKITRKGHEHITIMFIPHSEKRIFTFRISNFVLLFFVFILTVLTVGGSYLFLDRNNFEKKVSDLSLNYLESLSVLEGIKTHMSTVTDSSNKVLNVTQDILNIVDMNPIKKLYNSNAKGGPDESEYTFLKTFIENIDSLDKNQIHEIKKLLYLGKDLTGVYQNLKGLKGVLKNFKHVFSNIPSIYPVLGTSVGRGYVTSGFGWRRDPFNYRMMKHYGLDIANLSGTPVIATADGYVKKAGKTASKGGYVEVRHKYGYESRYYHMLTVYVQAGSKISKGQVIGRIGSTGRSTGPHLHYEVRVNQIPVDPSSFMNLDPFYN